MVQNSVVIDTDPGIDDVVALALAARSPELDVATVTTSYGNATLAATTRNAKQLLRLAGRADIPVEPGSDRPLERPLVTAPETHGETGVGHAAVDDEERVETDPTVILRVFERLAEPVTLVTLGPLTNLAHALRADQELVRRGLRRHIGMFGNINERGNANRWADFNAWCDPEAVKLVLEAGLETTMVGLDVTRRMTFTAHEVQRFAASHDPLISWLGAALTFYVEFHVSQERLEGCVVNDVLPIGELLSPGLLASRLVSLTIDLDEGEHRGHTRVRSGGHVTEVALEVDIPRMRQLLGRILPEETQ